jgi:hypothetical protein
VAKAGLPKTHSEERHARLAEALKENLKRRKLRQRGAASQAQPSEDETRGLDQRHRPKPASETE